MGMDSFAVRGQAAPTGNGVDVTDLVVRDLHDRREAGTKKYGTSLRTNNGRDALVDLYQEQLDAAMYVRQAIEERGMLEGHLRHLGMLIANDIKHDVLHDYVKMILSDYFQKKE